jgi:hypothetical protein
MSERPSDRSRLAPTINEADPVVRNTAAWEVLAVVRRVYQHKRVVYNLLDRANRDAKVPWHRQQIVECEVAFSS